MTDEIRPQTIKMLDSKVAALKRLPQFAGQTLSSIIRRLMDEAIGEETPPAEEISQQSAQHYPTKLDDYKDHDFTRYITDKKWLIVKADNFPAFWNMHGHRAILGRIGRTGYRTDILMPEPDPRSPVGKDMKAVVDEIVSAYARTSTPVGADTDLTLHLYKSPCPAPYFALCADDECYISNFAEETFATRYRSPPDERSDTFQGLFYYLREIYKNSKQELPYYQLIWS
ncbi:hypothetical protein AB9F35_14820 [Rhizobium leguminosarum]|uniref:hypothetical protein n=1 Tax=Rhizobium leguminosarum TaxID=384 RepID=UPI003F9AB676